MTWCFRASDVERENERLRVQLLTTYKQIDKLEAQNQWLLLQLGLLGYEAYVIPEVPAKPAKQAVRKVGRR